MASGRDFQNGEGNAAAYSAMADAVTLKYKRSTPETTMRLHELKGKTEKEQLIAQKLSRLKCSLTILSNDK